METFTVTSVEENRTHVIIYVDGSEFLRLKKKDFALMPLAEGDEIDKEEYVDRLSMLQSKPAYEAALTLLTARDMTAQNLYQALVRRGIVAPVAQSTCQRLIENGLINDERYANRYVELRQNQPIGKYAMKQKLRAKGIDEQTAVDALENIDDDSQLTAAKQLAAKLARKYEKETDSYKRKSKLSQAVARRGFSWDIVREAVEYALSGSDDDFEDDFYE